MKYSHWRIRTNARTEKNARVIANRAAKNMGVSPFKVSFSIDADRGHVITMVLEHAPTDWANFIYDVMLCAQSLGHGWFLTGGIDSDPGATTEHSRLPGVSFIQWDICANGANQC